MKFKLPSFRACLLACVARICGNGSDQQPPQVYVNRPMFRPKAARRIKPEKLVATGRFYSNQRQVRKQRRKAHAAGVRNAFS